MLIGVPKEIKTHEYRVGLTPASVREVVDNGHQVLVETKAGLGIGVTDGEYERVGAKIATTAADVFARADMIVACAELDHLVGLGHGVAGKRQRRRCQDQGASRRGHATGQEFLPGRFGTQRFLIEHGQALEDDIVIGAAGVEAIGHLG